MKPLAQALLLCSIVLACAGTPGVCPEPGLDSARRCRRKCLVGATDGFAAPLPCECVDACLCWNMAGHPRRPPRSDVDG